MLERSEAEVKALQGLFENQDLAFFEDSYGIYVVYKYKISPWESGGIKCTGHSYEHRIYKDGTIDRVPAHFGHAKITRRIILEHPERIQRISRKTR